MGRVWPSALLMAYLVSYKCTAVAVQITNATCATAILDNYIIKSELVGLLWLSELEIYL